MSRRRRVVLALAGAAGALGVALGAAVAWAPLYLLMPHQPRDTRAIFASGPVVVAHRGWSGVAPENTVAAMVRAADAGLWMELDVTLTRDGQVVVIHDDTLDRTTTGTGDVADRTLAEIAALDAGSWFAPDFAGERAPTLDQVFAAVPASSRILIELKTADDKLALPRAVVDAVTRAGRADSVIVISFDPYLLEQVRLLAPDLLRGQLVSDYDGSDLSWIERRALQNLVFTGRVQPDVILWRHDLVDRALVDRLKGKGYAVLVWTANEPADIARVTALGVDGILTDHPERALEARP